MSDLLVTAVSDILEKVIVPSIERNVYEKSALLQLFFGWSPEKNESVRKNAMGVKFDNNKVYFTVLVDHNPSAVAIAEDESLRHGKATTAQGWLPIATETASTTITKQTLNIKNKGAIVNVVQFESTNLINSMAMDLNRQAYQEYVGGAAVVASGGGGSNKTTIALKPSVNGDIDYAEFYPIGQYIRVGSSAVTKVVSKSTNTLIVDTAISFSDGDVVKRVTGSGTDASELVGLGTMIGTGDYANIAVASAPAWKAVVNAVNGAFDMEKMHQTYFKTNKLGNVDYIFMNQSLFAKYGSALATNVRFTAKDVLTGGWKGLDYMGGNATVVLDYMCPDDKIYFLSSSKLVGMEYWPYQFEKGTDGNLLRQSGTLSYELAASWSGQIGTFLRGAHGVMAGVTK